jgi:hypothetical protein
MGVPAGKALETTVVSGVSRVLKQCEGTAILSAASPHAGGTIVAAAKLVVHNKDALGVGVLDVQAGAKVAVKAGGGLVSRPVLQALGAAAGLPPSVPAKEAATERPMQRSRRSPKANLEWVSLTRPGSSKAAKKAATPAHEDAR